MSACVVLLSGGQDSTTVLYWALATFDEVHAVSVFYGQRHAAELEAAKKIAFNAELDSHEIIEADFLSALSSSALVTPGALLGDGGIPDREMPQGLPTSFVPGRNGLFLLIAAKIGRASCRERVSFGV